MKSLSRTSEPRSGFAGRGLARMPKHGRSAGRDHAPGLAGQILALQRAAGNRTVSTLISGQTPVTVQRLTSAAELEPLMTKRATFGRSTFALIHKALASYERAKTPAAKQRHLQIVERLIAKWLNNNAGSKTATDKRRRDVLETLQAEISRDRTQAQAQDIYMSNILKAGEAPSYMPPPAPDQEGWETVLTVGEEATDPAEKYQLEALVKATRQGVIEQGLSPEGMAVVGAYGLTQAEIAAIRIFTAEDYKYINPAMVGATWEGERTDEKGVKTKSWLTENIESKEAGDTFERGASRKVMAEEGGLHAGVAMQGLMKLPPYDGVVYRGAGYSDEDFQKKAVAGQQFWFDSFASSSKARSTAENFAFKQSFVGKTRLVVFVINDSGGRDVSAISLNDTEKEVAILPGSTYAVQSVKDIPPPSNAAKYKGQKWSEVELTVATRPPVPTKSPTKSPSG